LIFSLIRRNYATPDCHAIFAAAFAADILFFRLRRAMSGHATRRRDAHAMPLLCCRLFILRCRHATLFMMAAAIDAATTPILRRRYAADAADFIAIFTPLSLPRRFADDDFDIADAFAIFAAMPRRCRHALRRFRH
jgi:hypothetical protein